MKKGKSNHLVSLGIETTGQFLGLTLARYDEAKKKTRVLVDFFKPCPLQQSELIIPTLSKLLKKARLRKSEIDLIAVNKGPGSFTGVRVGLSTARALAQFLHCPLVGLSGLDVMAQQAIHQHKKHIDHIVAVSPALAGEIYFAHYKIQKGSPKLIKKHRWDEVDVFIKEFKQKKSSRTLMTGLREATLKPFYRPIKATAFLKKDNPPRSKTLVEMAIKQYLLTRSKSQFAFEKTTPMYLQPSWAERKKKK